MNSDGSFAYDPNDDYNGADSFTYRLIDPQGNFALGTVALTITPINDAPGFIIGPNISITDEESHVAPAIVLSFDALHGSPDAPFYFYQKDGFTVRPTDGRWLEAHDFSHITGYPAPAVWGDSYTGALDITRTDGGDFKFQSVDLTTWTFGSEPMESGQYMIDGLRAGQAIFSATGQLPPHAVSGFITVDSPSPALVDRLRLSFIRGTQAYIVDNIRLTPSPSVAAHPWATGITAGPADESEQGLHFIVTANTNPGLFAVPPAVDTSGNLTFVPRPNVEGTAQVTIVINDSGGTADGGDDVSSAQNFNIIVTKPHRWHNLLNALDVNNSGGMTPVSAIDSLIVFNLLNSRPQPIVVAPDAPVGIPFFYDTSRDNNVSALDALLVINYLNANSSPLADATFVRTDTTTQGNWQGQYGDDGYALALGAVSLPSYARVTSYGNTRLWAASTTDPRALQKPGTADRLAAAWLYNYNGFAVDVNIQEGNSHHVALYLLDWDGNNGRSQRVEVLDAKTGQVLDSQTAASFSGGKYLVWTISGHVQIRLVPSIADDVNTAVLSGIFFD